MSIDKKFIDLIHIHEKFHDLLNAMYVGNKHAIYHNIRKENTGQIIKIILYCYLILIITTQN
jgi:hypothetical protein